MSKEFWIDKDTCSDKYAIAKYFIETPLKPKQAIIRLAQEQSLATIPEHLSKKDEIIKKYAAKGITNSIKKVTQKSEATLSSFVNLPSREYYQFKAEIGFPVANFGDMLATMYNSIIGEVHNIGSFTSIKVLDIDFPKKYLEQFSGPAFGIEGIREILEERDFPIFMGPIKPCIGLDPNQSARLAYKVLKGGFHIVKDDELMVNTKYSKFEERTKKVINYVRKAESETGDKKMYFAHIGGDMEKLKKFYETAIKIGVDGIMVSPAINGLDIAKNYSGEIPIISHNTLMYASSRHPIFGVKFSLWSKLQRIAGADVMLCPSKFRSFDVMTEEEYQDNVKACHGNIHGYKKIFPAFSGGQCPASLKVHLDKLNTRDFIVVAGGAAYGHPMGAEAGAKSFVQAINALDKGIPLEDYAIDNSELKVSLNKYEIN